MIPVLEKQDGTLERVTGNPTLTSRDGERRASLATLLHESWSDADRAAFGVYLAEVAKVPRGKRQVGPAMLEKVRGEVRMVLPLEDAPTPAPLMADPLDELRAQLAEVQQRLAALEAEAEAEVQR